MRLSSGCRMPVGAGMAEQRPGLGGTPSITADKYQQAFNAVVWGKGM